MQSLQARVLAAAAAAAAAVAEAEAEALGPRTRNEPWVCSRNERWVCSRAVPFQEKSVGFVQERS